MKKNTIWNRNYTLVFIVNILTAFSFHIIMPTISKYVVSIGSGIEAAGFAATAFTVTAIIIRPFTGYYINTKRKKTILLCAMMIISVSILGYAFSKNTAILIFFRLLHGVGWGMVTTANSTVMVASLPAGKIGRGVGLFGIASSLASVFAPNLGIWLIEHNGYFRMFIISFVLAACGCLLSFLIDEKGLKTAETRPESMRFLEHLFAKEALIPAITILCVGMGMATISNFIVLYAEELQVENIGCYFTVAGAVMLIMRPLFGRLSDSRYSRSIILVSLIGYTSVFMVLGVAKTLSQFLLAAVLYGTFYGALCPIVQTWCVKAVDASRSGTANSTYYTALDVGQGLGASLAGILSVRINYGSMYLLMIIPQICAIIMVVFTKYSTSKKNVRYRLNR